MNYYINNYQFTEFNTVANAVTNGYVPKIDYITNEIQAAAGRISATFKLKDFLPFVFDANAKFIKIQS